MRQHYDHAGCEPRLDEVVADPVVRLTMRCDGVRERELWQVIREGRVRLDEDAPAEKHRKLIVRM